MFMVHVYVHACPPAAPSLKIGSQPSPRDLVDTAALPDRLIPESQRAGRIGRSTNVDDIVTASGCFGILRQEHRTAANRLLHALPPARSMEYRLHAAASRLSSRNRDVDSATHRGGVNPKQELGAGGSVHERPPECMCSGGGLRE
eukprot:CAMPEP_0185188136 /NCGR_PEP_ID=MMETSP1140-20130426/5216_1 /TAXON_ID=298111 /ORGANISM="Pavlova sp., Strain CCMP459" /LENGTH=144 /DNA_ID=CAMNT_0027754621 /DNA_START=75 /DNA_END=510 /DNA_ORIENTATION=+